MSTVLMMLRFPRLPRRSSAIFLQENDPPANAATTAKKILVIIGIFLAMTLPTVTHAQSPSLSATITVDRIAVVSTDRLVVTLTGTYTCGPLPQPQPTIGATFAGAQGQLTQAAGRAITEGGFAFTPVCDLNLHNFQTSVHAENMPWHGGPARVRVTLNVQECDEFFNCQFASATADVQINIRG